MQVRSLGGEDPLEAWQPTPVFLLGKSDGQRSLARLPSIGSQSQKRLDD